MKNAFSGLIGRLDAAEEGLTEIEDIPIEIFKTDKEKKKKKRLEEKKKKTEQSIWEL